MFESDFLSLLCYMNTLRNILVIKKKKSFSSYELFCIQIANVKINRFHLDLLWIVSVHLLRVGLASRK